MSSKIPAIKPPLVSIMIPVYNGASLVTKALESCFQQSYENLEIIVIDDCSTDQSLQVINQLIKGRSNTTLHSHPKNTGVSGAWNSALDLCTGDWVLRLAQDDFLEPFAISTLIETANTFPNADVIYADMWVLNENLDESIQQAAPINELFDRRSGLGLCVICSRAVIDSKLRYQTDCKAAEDLDYFVRVYDHGFQFQKHNGRPLMTFRQHSESGTSKLYVRQQLETAEILSKRNCSRKHRQEIFGKYYSYAAYDLRKNKRYFQGIIISIQGLIRSPLHLPLLNELVANFIRKKPTDQ